MANYIATTEELTAVANAIRAKGGTSEQLVFPEGFVSAIDNIQAGGGSPSTNAWYPSDTAFLIEHFPDAPTINQIGFSDTFPVTSDILGGVFNPYAANKIIDLTDLLKDYTDGTVFFDCFAVGSTGTWQRAITAMWMLNGAVSQRINVYGRAGLCATVVEDKSANLGELAYRGRFIIGWGAASVKCWFAKNSKYGDVGVSSLAKDPAAYMSSMVIGGQKGSTPYLYNGAVYNLGFVPRLITDDEAKAIIYR